MSSLDELIEYSALLLQASESLTPEGGHFSYSLTIKYCTKYIDSLAESVSVGRATGL